MDKLDLKAERAAFLDYWNDPLPPEIDRARADAWDAWMARARLQSLPQGGAPEIDPCRPKGARVPEKWIETYAENDSWGPVIQALARDLMDMTVAYGSAMKKLEAQGTARIQEAGTGAPGVRERALLAEAYDRLAMVMNILPAAVRRKWPAVTKGGDELLSRLKVALAPDKQAQKEGA